MNGFFTKEIERKSRPVNREIENIYRTTVKETEACVRKRIEGILKGLEMDVEDGDKEEGEKRGEVGNEPGVLVAELWGRV